MAEDKKGFILYADQQTLFEGLDDNEAGVLIKHIFRYVNDENPEPPDKITKISFEPIKQQLKRDLVKYEKIKGFRSEIGKIGGQKSGEARKQKKANEANASNSKQTEANEAVTVNVNVTDTVNVKDIYFKIKEIIYKSSVSAYITKNLQIWLDNQKRIDGTEVVMKGLVEIDKEYFSYSFADENHIKNSFKGICKKIKEGKIITESHNPYKGAKQYK